MESDGPHNPSDRDEPDDGATILRFPRGWFGPTEELVPFGPRADEPEPEGPLVAEVEDQPPATAASFWSADSEKIHDAVQGPVAVATPRAPRLVARRVLLAGACGLLGLGLLSRIVFQGGGHAVAGRVALVHVHPWSATSHPDVVKPRTKPVAKASAHKSPPARTRSQNGSAETPQSSGGSSPPAATQAVSASSNPPASSSGGGSSGGGSSGGGSSGGGASEASAGSSSQPAFGANGALGPGSSPNS